MELDKGLVTSQGDSDPQVRTDLTLLIAVLAILAVTAQFIASGTSGALPDSTPAQQLPTYDANRVLFLEYSWAFAFFAILGIPFLVALGFLVRKRNLLVSTFSTGLASAGILLLSFAANFWVGTLSSIDAANSSAPSLADSTYQAAVASNLLNYPTVFGWMLFGTGFFLLSWLVYNSGFLPRWLGVVGLIAGAAAWAPFIVGAAFPSVTDTPGYPWFSNPGFPIADIVSGVAFGIFGFALAILSIHRARPTSVSSGILVAIPGIVLLLLPMTWPTGFPAPFIFVVSGAVLVGWAWNSRRVTLIRRPDERDR